MIRYRVTPADPRAHRFEVACTVDRPAAGGQRFRLPAWTPGSYRVRDLARHVSGVAAACGDRPLALTRLDKGTLQCEPCEGPLTLRYAVYAFDDSVRKAYLDERRGFFNGTSLFYAAEGYESGPAEVTLERPPGPGFEDWAAATAMAPARTDADGFGTYRAADYREAADHPFELGRFERVAFDVDGIPHAFLLSGRYDLDRARLVRDVARICRAQRELFAHEPRHPAYLFLTRVAGSGHGGLEHRASCALVCARTDLPRPGADGLSREYRGFLGLVSHEYFHQWNVKRITAERFAASDLAAEAYTRDLWHYEGVTSYYDDLMLLRAGVLDVPGYLDVLAETATRLERTPGRRRQSLADASFEAWIKYYQPDENTPNATVSYYVKGALVALCLDLHLRRHSRVTLDDVMRELWRRHGATGAPVPEGGLERVAAERSGLDLAPQFDRWLRSTDELPLAELLAEFGVGARRRAAVSELDPGGRVTGTPQGASLGLRLRMTDAIVAHVTDGGPAQRAGLSGGDVLVALDGVRLTPGQWPLRQLQLEPGRAYPVHFFRGDELREAVLTAEPLPADTWTLLVADASGDVLERRRAWLGA